MKIYRMTEKVIVEPKEILDKVLCDICKKEIYNQGYEISEATVEVEYGENYGGDGGKKTILNIDICESCFRNKLIPLVEKEFNIEFQEDEIDW